MLPTIREVRLKDLYELSVLWEQMVREESGEDSNPDREAWARLTGAMFMRNPLFVMLTAKHEEKLIGFIMGQVFYNPCDSKIHGLSQTIYVMPEYRDMNVGLHLYHYLAKRLIRRGAEIISFYCKADKIEFWEKKGYSCTETKMTKSVPNLVRAMRI